MAARRTQQADPEELRQKLIDLLENFERELTSSDLREKVIALVPAHFLLRDIGCSLIPKEYAAAAVERILFYFKKYPLTVIRGEELMVVAGISEWARRVRELRRESGWAIASGMTAREMAAEGDFSLPELDVKKLRPDDYILLDENQDREAAFRWHTANRIRRKKASVKEKVLEYLLENIGRNVTGEELRYVANDKTEWARRVRELRTELGWQVMTKMSGMPDLPIGVYLLATDRQAPEHDRVIKDSVRCAVLQRDEYRCRQCGWRYEDRNPSDPRCRLEPHHVTHHAKGGENTVENLITLCNVCHDVVHRNK